MNAKPDEESPQAPFLAADCNAYAGSWPFRFLGESAQPLHLEVELAAAEIGSAWVSPLDALFNAQPYSANAWLLEETAGSSRLQAVPIFNPFLNGAGEECAKLLNRLPEIPAIRLTPGYHGYDANGPEAHAFIEQLPAEKVIAFTLRMQDRRGQPGMFPVPDAAIESAFALAGAHPEHTFLLCGTRLAEVTSAPERWSQLPNVHIETSFLDNISGIAECAAIVGDSRLHLGTLAPLLYASASVEKVKKSGLPEDRIRRILTSDPHPSRL